MQTVNSVNLSDLRACAYPLIQQVWCLDTMEPMLTANLIISLRCVPACVSLLAAAGWIWPQPD
jgi:hypothetical protein